MMNFHQERVEYTQSNGGTGEILLINISVIDRQNMFQEQEQSIHGKQSMEFDSYVRQVFGFHFQVF